MVVNLMTVGQVVNLMTVGLVVNLYVSLKFESEKQKR